MANGSQFYLDVSDFVNRHNIAIEAIREKVMIDIFTEVVIATPVDTGNARGSWQCTLDNPVETDTERLGEAGPLREIVENARKLHDSPVAYLSNLAPYILRLENDAWSKQAPSGMVKVTVSRYPWVVTAAARSENW